MTEIAYERGMFFPLRDKVCRAPAKSVSWHRGRDIEGIDMALKEAINAYLREHATADVRSAEDEVSLSGRFRELADKWSKSTAHISSVDDLTSHPSYQEIIRLGWDIVPFLLIDLQQNHRFWFPALSTITKVRPFDPSDAGNGRRMTEAWVKWGKRKGLI